MNTDEWIDTEEALEDRKRDLSLWLRIACKPDLSFKTEALSTLSIRTVGSVMAQRDDWMAWELSHQSVIIKSGMRLGLLKAA
jgi:hypothetical protein